MEQGAEVELEEVVSVEDRGSSKLVRCESGAEFEAKALIIATGAKPRMLGLEHEEELVGNGVGFCAVCDGAFYKGRDVAVNGGGNSGKGGENGSLADMISSLAGKYNGASEADLMRAIVKEAEKGKRNGTLSNEDIDRFAAMLSPMLDDKKRAYLKKVVSQLKNI